MNLQETLALIEMLKASGVTKFKSHEHDIELGPVPRGTEMAKPIAPAIPNDKEVVATEKLKTLINTINMSPEELANKMFPDGAI